jgi:hypothetical protein
MRFSQVGTSVVRFFVATYFIPEVRRIHFRSASILINAIDSWQGPVPLGAGCAHTFALSEMQTDREIARSCFNPQTHDPGGSFCPIAAAGRPPRVFIRRDNTLGVCPELLGVFLPLIILCEIPFGRTHVARTKNRARQAEDDRQRQRHRADL